MVDRRADRFDEALARVGPGARGVEVDVSDDDQRRALFEDLPRVDILCTFAEGAVFD